MVLLVLAYAEALVLDKGVQHCALGVILVVPQIVNPALPLPLPTKTAATPAPPPPTQTPSVPLTTPITTITPSPVHPGPLPMTLQVIPLLLPTVYIMILLM